MASSGIQDAPYVLFGTRPLDVPHLRISSNLTFQYDINCVRSEKFTELETLIFLEINL